MLTAWKLHVCSSYSPYRNRLTSSSQLTERRAMKADNVSAGRIGGRAWRHCQIATTQAGRLCGLGRIAGFISVLVSAGIMLFAVPGTAQAATAPGPSASLTFAAARVSSGTRPLVTFIAADIPAGSVIYLQQVSGTGNGWQNVGRTTADAGTVQLPADPPGLYQYRILVARGGVTIITSAPASLTVTGTPRQAGNASGCSSCKVASSVLPWLVPIVEPVIVSVAQQIGSVVLTLLGMLFGF